MLGTCARVRLYWKTLAHSEGASAALFPHLECHLPWLGHRLSHSARRSLDLSATRDHHETLDDLTAAEAVAEGGPTTV